MCRWLETGTIAGSLRLGSSETGCGRLTSMATAFSVPAIAFTALGRRVTFRLLAIGTVMDLPGRVFSVTASGSWISIAAARLPAHLSIRHSRLGRLVTGLSLVLGRKSSVTDRSGSEVCQACSRSLGNGYGYRANIS